MNTSYYNAEYQAKYYRDRIDKKKLYQKEYRLKNIERIKIKDRFKSLKTKYGVTQEVYDAMFKQQNGVCKICKQTERGRYKNLAVDHCHLTNLVRGLLCRRCNLGLAYLENKGFMDSASTYLQR
jgi:Recombination endonuclease VII